MASDNNELLNFCVVVQQNGRSAGSIRNNDKWALLMINV